MITARSLSGVRRTRATAVPLRALGLVLFLFGLMYTHALSPDATVRHLTVSVTQGPPGTDQSCGHDHSYSQSHGHGHRHDHGPAHTVEECALGQPQQGPEVGMPCLSPLSWVSDAQACVMGQGPRSAVRASAVPIAQPADSAILRM